jgi:hypothetical protein
MEQSANADEDIIMLVNLKVDSPSVMHPHICVSVPYSVFNVLYAILM